MAVYGYVLCTYVRIGVDSSKIPDYLVMIVLECIYQIRIICGRSFSVFIGYYSGSMAVYYAYVRPEDGLSYSGTFIWT